jgi:serine/threonine-protein kinase
MSTVYLAVRSDDTFKRQVAIKLVRRGMESAEVLRRLRSERQILASLDHPYIARLFDGGSTDNGLPYFVMEYVDGLPIDAYCRHNQLTVGERLTLFRKVCAAVHYAHQNLVVHRDIKPSNILVTADGEPKLLDFGIAKLLNPDMASAESEPTATWQRIMTPNYASPEQVRGKHITTASDTYSLGVLLYKLLTGRLPRSFKGRSQAEIEQLLTDTDPLPPSAAVVLPPKGTPPPQDTPLEGEITTEDQPVADSTSQIPEQAQHVGRLLRGDLDAIVLKALRSAPTRRYGSVEKLVDDIERFQNNLPVTAHVGNWNYRTGKFIARHRAAVATTTVVVVLLVAFAGAMAWQSMRIAHERDQARLERDEKQAVLGLLLEVFRLADPYVLPGSRPTVEEALVRSVPVLESRLHGQPDVRAELLYTSGSILTTLGLYQPAVEQLGEALALRQELHGDHHVAVVEILGALATVHTALGELDEAEALAQRGVELARGLTEDPGITLVSALTELVSVHCFRSEYEAAESPASEALALARTLPEGGEQETAALQFLALIHSQKGAYRDAAELNRQALAKLRRRYGERHLIQVNTLSNLGLALRRQEEYEAAESVYQDVLDLQRENFPEGYRDPVSFANLAGARLGRGDYPGAEETYRQALSAVIDSIGPDHYRVFAYELGIAQARIGQGKAAEAQEQIEPLLKKWRLLLGEDHWRITKGESVLGESLSLQGRCQEAGQLLSKSYLQLVESAKLKHRHKQDALERLRDHLERCGQGQEIAPFEAMLTGEAG